ncbi:NUDIX domain-containing protein [Bacillus cereus]|uniref:NUDIX domain-containing protein n=1 Tax=Bacillus cereus TaxID=1396 RepID=UPI001D15D5FE|nr:NUDIX domain-containing protein [Bacillus cereus]MCC3687448.1 NUDIX domain-containing protein [Bacillus cereus]
MTAKVTELFKNKWNTVVEKEMDNGCRYVYNKAEWCNSQGVAILPFRNVVVNNWGFTEREYLGRFEVCPAHSEEIELCSITGGMDKEGEAPVVTAWRELIEEGGYKVPVENIIYLGTVRPSKASDTTTHLFAVDLGDGFEEVEAVGDGTIGEEGAYCDWITGKQLVDAKDPLLHAMVMRLLATSK